MEKVGAYTDRVTESGEWRTGNAAAGQQATPMLAAYFNMLQRELTAIVDGADIALDAEDDAQLLAAINILIDRKVPDQQILSFNTSTTLEAHQMGLIQIDASGGPVTVELPLSDENLDVRDVIVRRVDNSGNVLKVQGAAANKIKHSTDLRAEGYGHLLLMGAGDYWWLRADGQGGWVPVARLDTTPVGRVSYETTTKLPPGGYGPLAGVLFDRALMPWLWDHAQQSGMLTSEAQREGMDGGWTSGDGALTFRGPDARAEFLRILDEGRGVDAGREGGSWRPDDLRSHSHQVPVAPAYAGTGGSAGAGLAPYQVNGSWSGSSGGAETRPRSIAYPGRIKLI